MHVLIINGSPRVKKYSNTDKILTAFTRGLMETGSTFEQYEISDRKQWEQIREAYYRNTQILIALPLYVECIPGLLMEFLETLKKREDGASLSFLLQSGFAEGCQLRCGEAYLEKLAGYLGCKYGGTLVKGDNFSIRFMGGETVSKITGAYTEMGREYGKTGTFFSDQCKAFTGPEILPFHMRMMVGFFQLVLQKKLFGKIAAGWGCTKPLDDQPYA